MAFLEPRQRLAAFDAVVCPRMERTCSFIGFGWRDIQVSWLENTLRTLRPDIQKLHVYTTLHSFRCISHMTSAAFLLLFFTCSEFLARAMLFSGSFSKRHAWIQLQHWSFTWGFEVCVPVFLSVSQCPGVSKASQSVSVPWSLLPCAKTRQHPDVLVMSLWCLCDVLVILSKSAQTFAQIGRGGWWCSDWSWSSRLQWLGCANGQNAAWRIWSHTKLTQLSSIEMHVGASRCVRVILCIYLCTKDMAFTTVLR